WTFEGGEPSTAYVEDPAGIVYSEAGDFDVTLTVSNMDGDSDTKVKEDFIHASESHNMTNGSITTCNSLFLDSGGETNTYSNYEDLVMTFYPETPNSSIKFEFIQFNVENHFDCGYDYMEIFDGVDVNAPIIGKWCGTNSPGSVIANNDEGALTVYFHSDEEVVLSGWKAIVTCDSNVGINQNEISSIMVFPNPASNQVQIITDDVISNIILSDMSGRIIYKHKSANGNHNIITANYERGIYLLSFNYNGHLITRKVVLK
ncbi:MAG: T9SS type A sorting domain-containing protein, partial [Bacteroidota bacterium]